ncbi:dihydrodipicolinate synthase family protein [Kribbella turkmenica]|uniref:Dihydrodipicolinate synthase family protein n=1 Tax=Kribbella turkmenica TaxID=2530375 RepID=A0A4R4X042_9ACTN|nr:dihydrodipicolinate synthase family protein [Kribbella turkmenica]TDD23490.1 dihydrodipicolinate synthase family protein [Kribbella turkmenica]
MLSDAKARALREGVLIPAHPLALTPDRTVDERRQRALSRYYLDAGAGGLAVGVHTTQFGIRKEGLLEPVLRLAAETVRNEPRDRPIVMVAGVAGPVEQAVAEAELAAELGYDLAMVILRDLSHSTEDELIEHIAAVGEVLPVFGFYLQAAVGGPPLGFGFWTRLAELPCLAAIKIAPFDRYRTIDVVRAVCESSRVDDIALYTGNDDNILVDLATTYRFMVDGTEVSKRIVGGLLGQNAVWTRAAVDLFEWARRDPAPDELLTRAAQLTDANSAVFDVAGGFAGCVAGIHEVLRRQGLLDSVRLLDPDEKLSPGQLEELDRVVAAYPFLIDDAFVAANLPRWLGPESP